MITLIQRYFCLWILQNVFFVKTTLPKECEIKSYKAIKLVHYSRSDNRVVEEFYELGEKIDYLTELSRKNDLRNRALQKLTKEEIEALGI